MLAKRILRPPLPPSAGLSKPNKNNKVFTPLNWREYFTSRKDVPVGNNVFRVYQKDSNEEGQAPSSKPTIVMLHGGGFGALTWACFSQAICEAVHCSCLCIDLRDHGDTITRDGLDMSANTLVKDIVDLLWIVFGDSAPSIFLIGHSMGGALAVRLAYEQQEVKQQHSGFKPPPPPDAQCLTPDSEASARPALPIIGLAVIDVVEGSAMDALSAMHCVIKSRPRQFATIERAIEWAVRSAHISNPESARVSMPSQLRSLDPPYLTATALVDQGTSGVPAAISPANSFQGDSAAHRSKLSSPIEEDEEEQESAQALEQNQSSSGSASHPAPPESGSGSISGSGPDTVTASHAAGFGWLVDLEKTAPFWTGWFSGLSSLFLRCSVPKLLLLAGIDRLDKELTIGQMQGKFQLQVLPAGHAVHEDIPDKVADAIANFLVRNKFAQANAGFKRSFPAC